MRTSVLKQPVIWAGHEGNEKAGAVYIPSLLLGLTSMSVGGHVEILLQDESFLVFYQALGGAL